MENLHDGLRNIKNHILKGEFDDIYVKFSRWCKKSTYFILFQLNRIPPKKASQISVVTDYPVAVESLDHIHPHGTKRDNSTNIIFCVKIDRLLKQSFPRPFSSLDLGCAGGGLVEDLKTMGFTAVGLEGSDYSLKHQRAAWKTLANKNLFTADITKPFQVLSDGHAAKFHLVTAWEVLEHIVETDLPAVFQNITNHLQQGGYFIASTSNSSDTMVGVELHHTQWPNSRWKEWVKTHFERELEPFDLNFSTDELVRFGGDSYLTYRKK